MEKVNRREFLKLSGAAGLALGLSACANTTSTPSNEGTEASTPSTSGIELTGPVAGSAGDEGQTYDAEYGNITKGPDSDQKTKITAATVAFESLAPYTTSGSSMQAIGYGIYESLWSKNYTGTEEIGVIAKDWTWTDDYTCDVTIYDYIHDVDGNPITADDVVFSFNTWVETGTNSYTKYIDSVKKLGDYEVEVVFNIKCYPSLLTNITAYIVNQKAYESSSDGFVSAPIGTGHYKVTEFISSSKLVMEQTYDHWQTDTSLVPEHLRANVDVVEYDVIAESLQIQTALQTGSIQYGALTASLAEDFKSDDSISIFTTVGSFPHCILLNCYSGPLAESLELRQAVLYAIDNESVAQAATYGTGSAAKGVGNSQLTGWQSAWDEEDYYDYNVDKAKELLASAGYSEGEVTLEWCSSTAEYMTLAAQIIQENLRAIGITLNINTYDQTTYLTNRNSVNLGTWDICLADVVPNGYVPVAYRSAIDNSSYDWGNMVGLKDDTMQELLTDAIYNLNDETVDALHQYVKDAACFYCLFNDYNFHGCDSGIEAITVGPTLTIAPNAFIFSEDYNIYA